MPRAPIAKWGEFELYEELGHGAFGRVYHAWDATLARDIALKIIQLPTQMRAAAALQEGRMLARVRHRNVVTVYGAQQIENEVGFWMELIRGRSLAAIVREQGPMGAEEAIVIGISLCQALAAVHAAGLVHRDIKANNVMREAGGRIVLMDFGTGRESALDDLSDFAGTPVYMAPEVINGHPASIASDLYSLAVLLYYLVTRAYPVEGSSVLDLALAHRTGQRQLLSDRRPDLPEAFVRAMERALTPTPELRPSTAGVLMQELGAALPGSADWQDRLAEALGHGGSLATMRPRNAGEERDARARVIKRRVIQLAGATVAILLAMGVFGFLTSVAFNQTLQREGFANEGPAEWFLFGARSFVAPAIYAVVAILLSRLALGLWRVIRQLVPSARRATTALTTSTTRVWHALGGTTGSSITQWLLLVHSLALVAIWLRFYDLLNAMIFLNEVPADVMRALDPANMQSLLYRPSLTILLILVTAGWHAVLSRAALARSVSSTTRATGAGMILITLLFLEVPYRLQIQNDFPRVDRAGARCYELGRRETERLLYCPDSPPRIHIVREEEVRLAIPPTIEPIFSPAPAQ